jgi:hypothetical protein
VSFLIKYGLEPTINLRTFDEGSSNIIILKHFPLSPSSHNSLVPQKKKKHTQKPMPQKGNATLYKIKSS